jgi:hypothetical protein
MTLAAPTENSPGSFMQEFVDSMRNLALVLLVLSNIDDFPKCDQLFLKAHYGIAPYAFLHNIRHWDGCSPISVEEGTFFELAILMIDGSKPLEELKTISLLSSGGWTVFLMNFSDEGIIYSLTNVFPLLIATTTSSIARS